MALIRYEPFNVLTQLQNEMGKLLGGLDHQFLSNDKESTILTSDWIPAVDIKEEQNRYVIKSDLPGVDSKDVHVTMENGILSIKGQRQSEIKEEKENYKRVERVCGSFYRRFALPDIADGDRIKAKLKDGVLEVVIPKQEKAQPKLINVETK